MFKELWENLLVSLVLENVLPTVDKIKLVTQPANSPDMNVNDNGLFNALQAGYKRYAPTNARDMIAAVLQVWKEYPHKKINHMFLTLMTNFDEVIKCHGDNEYKIRHMNKERLERLGQLPIVIPVTLTAQELVEEGLDPNYESDEEEYNLEELEQRYERYVPPTAISREELERLLVEELEKGEEAD
jgi:hypothetical protein